MSTRVNVPIRVAVILAFHEEMMEKVRAEYACPKCGKHP